MRNFHSFDFIIVGGGIVGLATAYDLCQRYSDAKILILEKEAAVAQHQSGRNSGVLHSGIYYKPGSLKAITCRQGRLAMEQFCEDHQIPFERCGKVIVATDESETEQLQQIFQRGQSNQIDCRLIDAYELKQLEPHASGISGVHVPVAGIVDYPAVCLKLRDLLIEANHLVEVGQRVVQIQVSNKEVAVHTASGESFHGHFLITCGGLYSDRLARMAGLNLPAQIVPFRGEYYELRESSKHLCRNLIYPVPNPAFPFLGVHFTRMVDGTVECGPNAVFALAREGYNWQTVRIADLIDSLRYSGFHHVARQHWRMGFGEIKRSLFKTAFVKALQKLIPEIRSQDLVPGRSGVRAQAIAPDGTMIDDFLWVARSRALHVCNAPSPAATASLEIGKQIVSQVDRQLSYMRDELVAS
jgi:(S)-2-hydroxyglutarate dehydrogenase